MIGLLLFVLAVLVSPFKSRLRLEAENAVLRHQLNVLRRRLHSRARLTNSDRWFFIQLYRWLPLMTMALQSTDTAEHSSEMCCFMFFAPRVNLEDFSPRLRFPHEVGTQNLRGMAGVVWHRQQYSAQCSRP